MAERRRLQPELRRQQIVDAAIQIFYEAGFEAASLRDLASRVGINKATIYHYFESKEEILAHIIDEVGHALLSGVRVGAATPGTGLDSLEAMIRFQIGYLESHVQQIKVLVEEKKSLQAELNDRVQRVEAEIFRHYRDVLIRCQEQGSVRDVHLATAAFAILGQINWLYHWYKPDGTMSTGQLAEEILGILFRGLLSTDAARASR